ncbi:MAG TPA: hypothetical protein VFA18_22575 [Gemmataceae bacterium]|nr:hypothetical protein [Gemmataceae bacterium]
MNGIQGLGNLSNLYATAQSAALSPLASVGGLQAATGDLNLAAISGPGQLYSNLQQLKAQSPAKFQQVVSAIASQLQSAAQQQGSTPTGQYLSQLASQFQNVAQNGDLSQLQLHHHGHHHGHHTYNGIGQATDSNDPATQAADAGLQQLFSTLNTEVGQALKS